MYRLWSIVDIVIIIINGIIFINVFDDILDTKWSHFIPVENMRKFEILLILFMWVKSLYFL